MNPLLIESLERQRREAETTVYRGRARLARRRHHVIGRIGELLIAVGARLAFSGVDAQVIEVRRSW